MKTSIPLCCCRARTKCARDDIAMEMQNRGTEFREWSPRRKNGRRTNVDKIMEGYYGRGVDPGTVLLRVAVVVWVAASSSTHLEPLQFCKQILVESWIHEQKPSFSQAFYFCHLWHHRLSKLLIRLKKLQISPFSFITTASSGNGTVGCFLGHGELQEL